METVEATSDTRALVRQTLRYLGRRVRVQRAILFGSHARGVADKWSDVDLAVVSPDFATMSHDQVIDLLVEVALAVDPRVEIRPYTPRDLTEARRTNFLGHILVTGRVVYQFRDGSQRRRSKTRDRGRGPRRTPPPQVKGGSARVKREERHRLQQAVKRVRLAWNVAEKPKWTVRFAKSIE